MIKWNLQDSAGRTLGSSVIVSLDVEASDDAAEYTVTSEGANAALLNDTAKEIAEQLRVATALRGHTLGKVVTAAELDAALRSQAFSDFAPRITEGKEFVLPSTSKTAEIERLAKAEDLGVHT
jgi:hypothetical protein